MNEPIDRYEEILQEMVDVHRAKKHDYGNSLWACEEFGVAPVTGILVRMSDKWSRIKTIFKAGRVLVADETMSDTLLDLAAYAILARIELEKTQP